MAVPTAEGESEAVRVASGDGAVGLLETWEVTIESDTPHYRESLREAESAGIALHQKVLAHTPCCAFHYARGVLHTRSSDRSSGI